MVTAVREMKQQKEKGDAGLMGADRSHRGPATRARRRSGGVRSVLGKSPKTFAEENTQPRGE